MDGSAETERQVIDWLSAISRYSKQAADAVIAMPWLQDGITATEAKFLDSLQNLNADDRDIAAQVVAMPWAQDGISEPEAEFLNHLENLEDSSKRSAAAIIAMPWVTDGINRTESDASEYLYRVAYYDAGAATKVIAMPFLQTMEEDDVLAIRGIHRLASNEEDGRLEALMEHPTLSGGITDAHTTLVAVTGTLWDTDEIRRMLNPGYAKVEVLSEGTELSPRLKVSIVSPGFEPGVRTAKVLWNAVTFAESAMGIPLPMSHVIVVLSDKAGNKDFRSSYNIRGFAISILPELAQERAPFDTYKLGTHSTHETAHFYWTGNEGWLNEGGAKMIEWMYGIENGASPGMLGDISRNWGCYDAYDLAALSSMSFDEFASSQACNHYLGYKLFKELFDNLGADKFKAGLRELYRLSLVAKDAGGTPGIAEVRQSFPDQSDIVEKHWSGNLNAPENRPFNEGIYRANHGLIQWDQYPTFNGSHITFSGTLLGEAVLSRETLDEARWGSGYQNFDLFPAGEGDFVGSILPPGRNWVLKYTGDNIATEYRLEGRTFTVTFPFPKVLGDPSDYIVNVLGFQNESKIPIVFEHGDRLGYARIRIE